MQLDYAALGNRVRERRVYKGLSQEKLAEMTSLSITHISNIEHAKTKVALPSLVMIANALDTTVNELLGDSLEQARDFYLGSIERELKDCTRLELQYLEDSIKTQKKLMRDFYKNIMRENEI